MQGRVAGVQVTQNSGAPGGGISVQIRGVNSLSANEPPYIIDGIAVVGRDYCKACGACVKACPQDLIDLILPAANIQTKCSNKYIGKDARAACVNSCIACRLCEKNCPADAVRVADNIAVIDPAKCIRCGMCAVKCPRGVIRDLFGIMTD